MRLMSNKVCCLTVILPFSSWYKRSEYGILIAIFFSAATVSGAFGGLLAARFFTSIVSSIFLFNVFVGSDFEHAWCRGKTCLVMDCTCDFVFDTSVPRPLKHL